MEPEIASLTSRQAQEALVEFYQLLPENIWEDESKLNQGEIESALLDIKAALSPDERQKLETLQQPENVEAGGAAAKFALDEFWQSDSLRGYVEAAIEEAKKPKQAGMVLGAAAGLAIVLYISSAVAKQKNWKFANDLDKISKETNSILPLLAYLPLP